MTLGTLLQLYAVARGGRWDRFAELLAALLVSVPVFAYVIAATHPDVVTAFGGSHLDADPYAPEESPFSPGNLRSSLAPFAATAVYLFAIQTLQAGPAFAEHADESFVRTARAKGAGPARVALHLLPHAVARTTTTLFTDMFGMVLIGLYVVEMAMGLPGFGTLTISAVVVRSLPLVVTTVVLTVGVAVVVNFLQDAYQLLIDPRVTDATGA